MIRVIELVRALDAVRLENVSKCHDPKHDARIRTAHDRENVMTGIPHPRQRSTERLIVVHVRQLPVPCAVRFACDLHQARNRHVVSSFFHCRLDVASAYHSNETELVCHGPGFETAILHSFRRLTDGRLRTKGRGRFPNRATDSFHPQLCAEASWQMKSILTRECLVDRHLLELLRDVERDEIGDHQWY